MGIIDVTNMFYDGLYSPKYDTMLAWLEECCGPRIFGKREPNASGIIPVCQSSNWRLFAISYPLRRAYPDIQFRSSGWVIEFDNDSDLLMFTLRWK